MIKLAIFDLDGTLINSIFDLADCVNRALSENGYPVHDYEAYKKFVGNGAKVLCRRALPDGSSEAEALRIHEIFSVLYREGCMNKTLPYDGIGEVLKSLRSHGIKLAVASNKPDEFSKKIVHNFFGEDGFDLVLGKSDNREAKPSPDIVFDITSRLGIDLTDTVMIGDSDVDVSTAHNAGIKCIGCEWGFRGKEELVSAGAEFLAVRPTDIVTICLEEM